MVRFHRNLTSTRNESNYSLLIPRMSPVGAPKMGILKPASPLADAKSGLSASVMMEKQQAAAASAAASNNSNRLAEPRLSDDTKSSGGSHYR